MKEAQYLPAGRRKDPDTLYKMRLHTVGPYVYAATLRSDTDPASGKRKQVYVHWGRLTADMKFEPNDEFILLSPEERSRMIFPADWNVDAVMQLPSARKPGRPGYAEVDKDRMYGGVWFLEQIAGKLGLVRDLERVFDGNKELATDILTIAMYACLTKEAFSHLQEWQMLEKYPAVHRLTSDVITRLSQRISVQNRNDLFRCRQKRIDGAEVCAVDSTTRRACSKAVPDIQLGKSKEGGYRTQTSEVVVYSLARKEPVYYRTFAGNTPDCRSLRVILADMRHQGFTNLVLVTDRGYECAENTELCVRMHQSLITAAQTDRAFVTRKIESLSWVNGIPEGMEWISGSELWGRSFDLDLKVKGRGGRKIKADQPRLMLYYNPQSNSRAHRKLQEKLSRQKQELSALQAESVTVDAAVLAKKYPRFTVTVDQDSGTIASFVPDEKAWQKAARRFGFFALVTLGVDYTPAEALSLYRLRKEQEDYFKSMKSRIRADRQRSWTEPTKRGRRFIEFVALILISYVKHVWQESDILRREFPGYISILNTMRSIRCLEHNASTKVITPFIGKQITICREFGFRIPAGCEPGYLRETDPVKSTKNVSKNK